MSVKYTVCETKPVSEVFGLMSTLVWLLLMSPLLIAYPVFFALFYYFPVLRLPLLGYLAWIFVIDRGALITGRKSFFKSIYWNFPHWKGFAGYFPAKLVKTADLDPTKKYLFGFHPHGLYGISLFACCYNQDQWLQQSMFPGIDLLVCTLPANFYIPFWRDWLLSVGVGNSSAESIRYRINNGDPGTGMVIAVGGQEEFRHMKPGTLDLVLKNRKGFVKIAIQTGVSLVPILSFGENDLYEPIQNKKVKKVMNNVFYSLFKASAPLIYGRWGTIIPKKKPIHVVVGRPLEIKEANPHPTPEEIDRVHKQYLDNMRQLYDDFKDIFHKDRAKDMTFV
ncbi:diacylglycerol O-acyltransferase 1 [Boothiomyces macroporosus]|uniref:Diacylglycerol O-acyltransferase n=1 Tax=Boothiomyces macroporosus TaxID=261099 RepID=A0AAD5Y052_9FUNG|nr:diacylglycerol O-acyltransferase 1 [Boothiomyces macroporosus]